MFLIPYSSCEIPWNHVFTCGLAAPVSGGRGEPWAPVSNLLSASPLLHKGIHARCCMSLTSLNIYIYCGRHHLKGIWLQVFDRQLPHPLSQVSSSLFCVCFQDLLRHWSSYCGTAKLLCIIVFIQVWPLGNSFQCVIIYCFVFFFFPPCGVFSHCYVIAVINSY